MNKKIELYLYLVCGTFLLITPLRIWLLGEDFNPRAIAFPFIGIGFISRYVQLKRNKNEGE